MTAYIANLPRHEESRALLSAFLLALIAEWLWVPFQAGFALAVFGSLLAVAVLFVNMHRNTDRFPVALLAGFIALLPLIEDVSPLSASIAVSGMAFMVLLALNIAIPSFASLVTLLMRFGLYAPASFPAVIIRLSRSSNGKSGDDAPCGSVRAGRYWTAFLGWILPIGLGGIFASLFILANPMLERWLEMIDIGALLKLADPARLIFWLFVMIAVWPFLLPYLPVKARSRRGEKNGSGTELITDRHKHVFGVSAILRALIVFNFIFFMQTASDLLYLWGGFRLPEGMSYASYAHRGAYPLVVAALMAAGFTLAATWPGSNAVKDTRIICLVKLWLAQTVLLVISSIYRLDLYVDAFGLTYWRVAAFVWMGLVATGLVLILGRLWLNQSTDWLLGTNLLTLTAVLYSLCFADVAGMIARHNVDRAVEGGSVMIEQVDVAYLANLGPQSIPALDRLIDATAGEHHAKGLRRVHNMANARRKRLVRRHHLVMRDWRGWSLRGLALSRYLSQDTGYRQTDSDKDHQTGKVSR